MQQDSAEAQALIGCLRAEISGLLAVYLYGSEACETARPDSDLDLAVVADQPLSSSQRWDLSTKLVDLAGREVDLVDLRQVGLPLAAQVLQTGRLLFVADPARLARFENVLMSRWCAFNEEREALVADIVARGSVYGG